MDVSLEVSDLKKHRKKKERSTKLYLVGKSVVEKQHANSTSKMIIPRYTLFVNIILWKRLLQIWKTFLIIVANLAIKCEIRKPLYIRFNAHWALLKNEIPALIFQFKTYQEGQKLLTAPQFLYYW